jgi:hypothetical protein
MRRTLLSTSPILLAALAACSDAPGAAHAPAAHAPAASNPHDPHAGLPAGHPPLAPVHGAEDVGQVAGRAVLRGELASATGGCLFVTLRQAGQRMPTWTYRVDLDDPDAAKKGLAEAKDGARELTFVLNQRTSLMKVPVDTTVPLEVQVMFDPDGNVDSREGQVSSIAPAKLGDEDVRLELAPEAK